jgi:hypothetical protein
LGQHLARTGHAGTIQRNPHYAETLTGTHGRHAMAIAVATAASSRALPTSVV